MTTLDLSCPPGRVDDVRSVSYLADPRALRHARRYVDVVLTKWGAGEDVCSAAVCIASELIANSIRHTKTKSVGLVLRRSPLRIEVSDSEPALIPWSKSPGAEDESGRGLLLVRDLSKEYGVTTGDAHKTVWAELVWQ